MTGGRSSGAWLLSWTCQRAREGGWKVRWLFVGKKGVFDINVLWFQEPNKSAQVFYLKNILLKTINIDWFSLVFFVHGLFPEAPTWTSGSQEKQATKTFFGGLLAACCLHSLFEKESPN